MRSSLYSNSLHQMPLITLCQLRYYMLYRRNSQELKNKSRKT